MKQSAVYVLGSVASSVAGHGFIQNLNIDGNNYAGYDPWVDRLGARRIVWGFPSQSTGGIGPVTDVNSPDITCRKNPQKPALTAKARAGSKVRITWSNWLDSHKGPVLTYLARYPDGAGANVKPQDLEFFKIDENAYNKDTRVWGTDLLLKQNNTWDLTIPSDIKPGKYMLRHELVALHFSARGNPNGAGTDYSGAQFYPECADVEITGAGNATPPGVKFPGGYKPNDPGVLYNLYFGPNQYISPGPPLYKPANPTAPVGPAPKVTLAESGGVNPAGIMADSIQNSIIAGFNKIFPGSNGFKWNVPGAASTGAAPAAAGNFDINSLIKSFIGGGANQAAAPAAHQHRRSLAIKGRAVELQ